MNDKKHPWQRTFRAFAGPGIDHPSDMMRVTEAEARTILARLAAQEWLAPVHAGVGRHAGYTVSNATSGCCTALFHDDTAIGFYAESYLWIAREHRGRGLSTPLILAAAEQRDGTTLPAGVVFQGYTAAGVAAHRAAHSHAILTAVAGGLPVPAAVLAEMHVQGRIAGALASG